MEKEKLVAIVTGAATGIGKCTAEVLMKADYRVCIADIDEPTSVKTREELGSKLGLADIIYVKTDVTDAKQFSNCFEEVLKTFKRVDVLINNAGILDDEQWEETLNINVNGVILGCKTAIKYMGKDSGGSGGHVINIASVLGLMPTPSVPVYVASKHAVVGLTRAYGEETHLAKHGIRFNAVCPSHVNTELQVRWRMRIGVTPWPELMEPSYIAQAILKVLQDDKNGACLLASIKGGYQYIGLPDIISTFSLD